MSPEQLSFRDPDGRVFRVDGRILREIRPEAATTLSSFVESSLGQQLVANGRIIGTKRLSDQERSEFFPDARGLLVEHPAVPFVSYPYEWSPEMVLAAGTATLDLSLDLVNANLGLKDASAYNLLFDGPRPVFVDVLSVEQRRPGDSRWLPYSQFQRHFVLPLLANKHCGLSFAQAFLSNPDGIEPETLFHMVGAFRRMMPPFLGLVFLPTVLGQKRRGFDPKLYAASKTGNPEQAQFVLSSTLRYLRRQLLSGTPDQQPTSTWSNYMQSKTYSEGSFETKSRFVGDAIAEVRPNWVLDIGCNTGHFSALAAAAGSKVVAIDIDPAVVDSVYRTAREKKLEILPLNVNLSLPTPAVGWRNRERQSFLDRAHERFDLVLALAVLHHMLVTDRIPLNEAIDCLAGLTKDAAVIEFVEPQDEMFRQLARGRDDLFRDLDRTRFESACARHFETVRVEGPLNGTRWLYFVRRRQRPM